MVSQSVVTSMSDLFYTYCGRDISMFMSVHLKTRNINILIKGEKLHLRLNKMVDNNTPSGANPGFQVRGGGRT